MWVIQDSSVLLQLPADAPLPPGSVPVELPSGFWEEPGTYVVRGGEIVRRPEEELRRRRERRAAERLSGDEIRRIRRALRTGEL